MSGVAQATIIAVAMAKINNVAMKTVADVVICMRDEERMVC